MTDWIVDTVVATSGLALLVLLVREPVRRRFGSRVTYGLWLIPAARLLMPTLTRTIERTIPEASQPLLRPVVGEPLLLSNIAAAEPSFFARIGGWPTLLLTVWLGVAAILFLSRMIAFHRDRRAIVETSLEIGRVGSIRIIRSHEIASPVAFGIFSRVIAVPSDFQRLYSVRERRLALEHELAHHRSGDLVANLIAFVLLCLQWFNPLAWIAHSAFRFDQEAACDDRVLDKATAHDRADYGRTIAKAASGRALLFASALDQPHSLHRRLQSMLRNSHPRQRLAGRLLVGIAIAVALPVTASRAVQYIDVPSPHAIAVTPAAPPLASVRHSSLAAPIPAAVAAAQAAPRASADGSSRKEEDLTISGDFVTIDGKRKRIDDLTPAERARVRSAVATARASLANVHFDSKTVIRNVNNAMASIDQAKLAKDLAGVQANVAEAMRNLDENGDSLRRFGIDPERLRATVGQSSASIQAIDVQAIQQAIASVDPQKIASSLDGADESIRNAQSELDRLDAKLNEDKH
jgi:beta-lactamase regulating signal transducer with metallopeptidase domain